MKGSNKLMELAMRHIIEAAVAIDQIPLSNPVDSEHYYSMEREIAYEHAKAIIGAVKRSA